VLFEVTCTRPLIGSEWVFIVTTADRTLTTVSTAMLTSAVAKTTRRCHPNTHTHALSSVLMQMLIVNIINNIIHISSVNHRNHSYRSVKANSHSRLTYMNWTQLNEAFAVSEHVRTYSSVQFSSVESRRCEWALTIRTWTKHEISDLSGRHIIWEKCSVHYLDIYLSRPTHVCIIVCIKAIYRGQRNKT